MSFFYSTPTDFQNHLGFDDLNINPDAETMFLNGCKKNVLLSRNFYQYATSDEIKMNEMLLEDYFKYEKMPAVTQSNSPLPSTVGSVSEASPQNIEALLRKRNDDELASDFSVESDYITEEEEEFISRKVSNPHRKNLQEKSLIYFEFTLSSVTSIRVIRTR